MVKVFRYGLIFIFTCLNTIACSAMVPFIGLLYACIIALVIQVVISILLPARIQEKDK